MLITTPVVPVSSITKSFHRRPSTTAPVSQGEKNADCYLDLPTSVRRKTIVNLHIHHNTCLLDNLT